MLKLDNITKKYGTFEAVKHVSFNILPGEIVGFLGPNGAGKTTTIKMCCGLLMPDSGTITIGDENIATSPERAKKLLGYVPDDPFLYDKLTGRQFVHFVGEIYGVPPMLREQRVQHYLEQLDMIEKADDLIGSYSRGMKRKIALMAGIIHAPKVLLLDEPTLGLDAISAKRSKDIIRKLAKEEGTAVLITTHVMEIAEQICDRIAVISKGSIIAQGTLEQLQAQAQNKGTLEDVFMTLTGEQPVETEGMV